MIKYRPVRRTLSASLKEEQIFATMDELMQFVEDRARRFFRFVGCERLPQIIIAEPDGDDLRIGWKNVQAIFVENKCVGYCGE